MEYFCLIFQTALLLATIFLPTGHEYLVVYKKIYKTHLLVQTIMQTALIFFNVIVLFVNKDFMRCVLFIHFILSCFVIVGFDIKAKRVYFKELEKRLREDKLLAYDSGVIRRFLAKKYDHIYSVKDIDKTISKIKRR